MSDRIVYLNGEWLPETEAKVSIFDRAFLFGDAIYEVTAVVNGKLLDYPGHTARLNRSLNEIGIKAPVSDDELLEIHREIVRKNEITDGLIYLQISRGAADRDFTFKSDLKPTITLFTQVKDAVNNPQAETGISVITVPDQRWRRCDIKTVQLLYPSLAKMEAKSRGADDAWLILDGMVTEASSATAHIIDANGKLITRQLTTEILPGITRASILDIAKEAGVDFEERAFSPEEAKNAAEAFITSATAFVTPVVKIDDTVIGEGKPGPVSKKLRELYIKSRIELSI
ncbi:MAG: D-amino-acid transaminase [Rhodobacteraceae bacterium]|nr:D-amino-acid transaminase [Paracoccaceae bacterium]